MLHTNRFPAANVVRTKELDLWYDQNKLKLSLDVSAKMLTNLHILLRNGNGIRSARTSENEDKTRHGAQYMGRIPTSRTNARNEAVYNGQTRRHSQTVDQCFIARMRNHHNDYLRDDHWNPKEYAALCDPPSFPLPSPPLPFLPSHPRAHVADAAGPRSRRALKYRHR
jgi:hypothetical protein